MILTSPSRDVARINWTRVEQLHAFVRSRAVDRLKEAQQTRDPGALRAARQNLHAIDAIYVQARNRRGMVASCAIRFFRARAMRDAQHPDFLGEWLGTVSAA
jgi:hypothetical protein